MSKAKATRPTPSKADELRQRTALRRKIDHSPDYIALRMRGLAALIGSAGNNHEDWEAIDRDAAFFIFTELDEMAERLAPGSGWRPER